MRAIQLYGRGDIKQVSFSRELEVDFKEAYGISLGETISSLGTKTKFDTYIEYLEYDRDILKPELIRKINNNPEMYPPKRFL